ncbi:MAG: AzlD domain-containing protein [Candidatus Puniceispirillaceae bacterium]
MADLVSPWAAVIAAIIATASWRIAGVLTYRQMRSDSLLMRLINLLAYSLLGSVMVMLMINPTGLLATASLSHRMVGLIVGICLLFVTKKLPIALCGAIGSFGFLSLLF